MKKRIRAGLFVILLVMFCVSGYMYIDRLLDYRRGEEIYDDAQERFIIALPEPDQTEEPPDEEEGQEEEPPEEAEPALPAIPPITMDFDAMAEINSDIIGWITIPDTKVNYPLLQGRSNDDYLRRAYNKVYSRMGSIFMDPRCSADLSDKHTIIYGHNMRNSTMFSPLLNYRSQSFYDSHRYFYIYKAEGRLTYEIFSAYMLTLPSNVYTIGFKTVESFTPYVSEMTANTLIASNIFPTGEENVVTLSTCSSTNNDSLRFVVHGRLVEDTRGN